MKNIFVIASMLTSAIAWGQSFSGKLSGEVTLENRFFPKVGQFKNSDKSEVSIVLRPEYSHAWDNDRRVVTIIPFARINDPDSEKTHVDLREASFVGSWDKWEIRAGISKVFWGVAESTHLVDVINQTDFVENIDGEDKLGQPMLNPTFVTEYGNFDFFVLPYFRESTFPGYKGRMRTSLVVETDNTTYLHEDEERHTDYAVRWSHFYGNLDIGLSFFKGTDREAQFSLSDDFTKLKPLYVQTEQFGIDLQYIYQDWLLKGELIRKDSQLKVPYIASVVGFEYTFTNINNGMDIGILAEWLFDERSENSSSGLYDGTFLGSRIAFNDTSSTELLAGGIINNTSMKLASLRLEASRRINENWKWELEASAIVKEPKQGLLSSIKDDDYIQFSLSFYY